MGILLSCAIAAKYDIVFCDLHENERFWSFRTALRTHKLDHCGHFEPHIEVSVTIMS